MLTSPLLIGLVVQEIDKAIDLSFFMSLLEIDVLPAPDGDDKTIQKFLLLKTKDYTCVCSSKTKRIGNNIFDWFRDGFMGYKIDFTFTIRIIQI